MRRGQIRVIACFALLMSGTAWAASPTSEAPAAPAPAAPDKLTILFSPGSAAVNGDGTATLDKASRLYRAGNPIVMIVSGSTDATGSPSGNLTLSERRARAVLTGLVDRGIPVQRLQLLAAGTTEPAVKTAPGQAAPENRRVDITWR